MLITPTQFDAAIVQTEESVAQETDRSRRAQKHNKGLSMATVVAFGVHGSGAHFEPFNGTDTEVSDRSTLIIESGGQYADGTTKVTRTMHMGEPSQEQKDAYTNVLRGIIQLSMLVFPENLRPSEVDALTRFVHGYLKILNVSIYEIIFQGSSVGNTR